MQGRLGGVAEDESRIVCNNNELQSGRAVCDEFVRAKWGQTMDTQKDVQPPA